MEKKGMENIGGGGWLMLGKNNWWAMISDEQFRGRAGDLIVFPLGGAGVCRPARRAYAWKLPSSGRMERDPNSTPASLHPCLPSCKVTLQGVRSSDFRIASYAPCSHGQGGRPHVLDRVSPEVRSGWGRRDLAGSAYQMQAAEMQGYPC